MSEQAWLEQRQALQQLTRWDIQARAAIQLEGEAYNLGIRWRYRSDRSLLLLQAPFGQGVIQIESDAAGFHRLSLPDGRSLVDSSPEALLEQVIGWSIPVSGLEHWVRGLPRPDSEFKRRIDDQGLPRRIEQDQWSIDYLDYFEPDDPPWLPRRIQLEFEQISMRLVIDQWQQAASAGEASELFPEFD